MSEEAKRFRANTPTIAAEDIDGEVVIVNFETGHYFSLRETAADVWRLLEAGTPIDEMTAIFSANSREVSRFVDSLVEHGLMIAAPTEGRTPGETPGVGPYREPVLERFEEMSDMLLYDPIHDVDDTGWPNLPGDAGKAT